MRVAQTSAQAQEAAGAGVATASVTKSPAINAAKQIASLSNLRPEDPFCAESALAPVALEGAARPGLISGEQFRRCFRTSKVKREQGRRGQEGRRERPDALLSFFPLFPGIVLMSYETIQFEMQASVAVITLNRPEALNALTAAMGNEFLSALNEAREQGARVIILTGAGRAFSAGGDLREMRQFAEKEGRIEAFFDEPLRLLNDCILKLRRTPLPIIAAVNGAASGGGCSLALACDLVLAGESARFNQAFVKVGLTPDCGGTYILPRLVGWKRATELLMTGDVVEARRAAEIGMINAVVPDEELMTAAYRLAGRLANAPTAAIGRIKELLEQSATNDLSSQLDLERKMQLKSGQTEDFKEGVAAFIEKRPPKFKGG
jgi:2-(1,2-epoxy-1,2-dihydrophenyl)acetyl-CoA isomerase